MSKAKTYLSRSIPLLASIALLLTLGLGGYAPTAAHAQASAPASPAPAKLSKSCKLAKHRQASFRKMIKRYVKRGRMSKFDPEKLTSQPKSNCFEIYYLHFNPPKRGTKRGKGNLDVRIAVYIDYAKPDLQFATETGPGAPEEKVFLVEAFARGATDYETNATAQEVPTHEEHEDPRFIQGRLTMGKVPPTSKLSKRIEEVERLLRKELKRGRTTHKSAHRRALARALQAMDREAAKEFTT